MAATTISLKLFIDKKSERVLYAEANKEFVDFLFNFLTLPLGNVTQILKEKGMGGCLPSLFESIENLSDAYFLPDQPKDFVLNPVAAVPGPKVLLLLPNVQSSRYREDVTSCSSICCHIKRIQERLYCHTRLCDSCTSVKNRLPISSRKQGYVKGMVKYIVMDDLEVKPMFNISFLTLINEFNVEDVGSIEEKKFELGINEVLETFSVLDLAEQILASSISIRNCHIGMAPVGSGWSQLTQIVPRSVISQTPHWRGHPYSSLSSAISSYD